MTLRSPVCVARIFSSLFLQSNQTTLVRTDSITIMQLPFLQSPSIPHQTQSGPAVDANWDSVTTGDFQKAKNVGTKKVGDEIPFSNSSFEAIVERLAQLSQESSNQNQSLIGENGTTAKVSQPSDPNSSPGGPDRSLEAQANVDLPVLIAPQPPSPPLENPAGSLHEFQNTVTAKVLSESTSSVNSPIKVIDPFGSTVQPIDRQFRAVRSVYRPEVNSVPTAAPPTGSSLSVPQAANEASNESTQVVTRSEAPHLCGVVCQKPPRPVSAGHPAPNSLEPTDSQPTQQNTAEVELVQGVDGRVGIAAADTANGAVSSSSGPSSQTASEAFQLPNLQVQPGESQVSSSGEFDQPLIPQSPQKSVRQSVANQAAFERPSFDRSSTIRPEGNPLSQSAGDASSATSSRRPADPAMPSASRASTGSAKELNSPATTSQATSNATDPAVGGNEDVLDSRQGTEPSVTARTAAQAMQGRRYLQVQTDSSAAANGLSPDAHPAANVDSNSGSTERATAGDSNPVIPPVSGEVSTFNPQMKGGMTGKLADLPVPFDLQASHELQVSSVSSIDANTTTANTESAMPYLPTSLPPGSTTQIQRFDNLADQTLEKFVSQAVVDRAETPVQEKNITRLQIAIDPADLGEVRIEITKTSLRTVATMTVANEYALQQMQSNIQSLQSSLESMGVEFQEVDLEDRSHSADQQRDPDSGQNRRSHRERESLISEPEAQRKPEQTELQLRSAHVVDILI